MIKNVKNNQIYYDINDIITIIINNILTCIYNNNFIYYFFINTRRVTLNLQLDFILFFYKQYVMHFLCKIYM